MAQLLEKDITNFKPLEMNQLVKGTVINATKTEVLVDVEGITTGIIRGKELSYDTEEQQQLKVGDNVEATVIDLENEIGMLELSFRFASHQKAWENLDIFRQENKIVSAKILDANKGGLLITVNGVKGFLPVSQLNPEHYPRVPGGDKNKILDKLKSYVGESFEAKVIDVDESQEKLIVSEKAAWEETQKDVLDKYKVGDVIDGTITAVTDFGIFIKFGENLEGLVHISELAWQRIDNPAELFKVGQDIKAEIINIEGSKIFLSIKKLQTDPWTDIEKKYKVGQLVKGKVLKVNPFGLFVELDKDIHGLAHVSELSNKTITNTEDIAKPGDEKEFKIVSIEPNEHRLGLSLKDLEGKASSASTVNTASKDAVEEKETEKVEDVKQKEHVETTEDEKTVDKE
ncbi:hypothetical protein A2533_00725 [Candidatus Falkowbacteria bacterium RIFOXYD2_FULL_35_9]|nr:MAG: hypothetical protein A2533_00725 [Candidatus Falkowbacteria bacterium RIFOXYD2_FULL_35_9]